MSPGVRRTVALVAMTLAWLVVVGGRGAWRASQRPSPGVLSRTFQGWLDAPTNRHIFLAQYDGTEFNRGRAYSSYTYPFLFTMFLIVTPVRALAGVPYDVAHNALPWLYAACLASLLLAVARPKLLPVRNAGGALRWILVFVSIGLVVTSPLVWISLLSYNRDNIHVLAAAAFCFLSTFTFRERVPIGPWTSAGVFLALWAPIYIPAWVLAGLVSRDVPVLNGRWLVRVAGVGALAAINLALPSFVGAMTGVAAVGSGFAYRSGLDGATSYFSTIPSAMLQPADPRSWPAGLYAVAALGFAAGFHVWFRRSGGRTVDQLLVAVLPYFTVLILLPQFTSIHPYLTDLLVIVPANFVVAFWSLQPAFADHLNGRGFVIWALSVGALLMTNLLTIAQRLGTA